MFYRNLRIEDVEEILISNEEFNKKDLTKQLQDNESVGVFKDDKLIAYILTTKKLKKDPVAIDYFYSKSVSASVVLWSFFFKNNERKSIIYCGDKEVLNRYIPFVEKLIKGISIIDNNEEIKIRVLKHEFNSIHLEIVNTLTQYTSLNVGMRIFLYDLLKKLPVKEIESRKDFITRILHRRNLHFLSQIHSDFLIASVTERSLLPSMREGYFNKIKSEGYREITKSKEIKNIINDKYSYSSLGSHFFDIEPNKIRHTHLIKLPSPFYRIEYALFRSQMKFIKRVHRENGGNSKWYLLDKQGYSFLPLHSIPDNIHHLIPRNFGTIFEAVIRDIQYIKELIEKVNQIQPTVLDLEEFLLNKSADDYYREEDYWQWYDLISYFGKLRKMLGDIQVEKVTEYFFTKYNCRAEEKRRVFLLNYMNRLKTIVNSRILTKKATVDFFTKYSEKKQEAIHIYLSEFYSMLKEEKSLFNYKEVRKRLSLLIKKKKLDTDEFKEMFLDMLNLTLTNPEGKKLSKVAHSLLEEIVFSYLEPLATSKNIGSIYKVCVKYLINPETSNNVAHIRTFRDIFKIFYKNDLINSISHQDYLFTTLMNLSNQLGRKFFLKFSARWKRDINSNEDPNRYIHDSGYVYQEFSEFCGLLSNKSMEKAFIHHSVRYIRKLSNETRNALNTLKAISAIGQYDVVYRKIEDIILNESDLDSLQLISEEDLLSIVTTKYNVNKGDIPFINTFISRMKKYNSSINVVDLFSVFENKALDIIKGEHEGIFKEKSYSLPQIHLANVIKDSLGDKQNRGTISNPQRLFTKLNRVGDVQQFIKGEIPAELTTTIIDLLKERRVSIPEEVYQTPRFKGLIERKCSPEYLVAGDASVCCMGFGADNAYDYAMQKGFGIFNVYYKERIIANSVIWINDKFNSLVIDNIEVHPNYSKFNEYIKQLYFEMIEDVLNTYNLKFAVQGASYNDLKISLKGVKKKHSYKGKMIKNSFYTDAEYVSPIILPNQNKKEILSLLG